MNGCTGQILVALAAFARKFFILRRFVLTSKRLPEKVSCCSISRSYLWSGRWCGDTARAARRWPRWLRQAAFGVSQRARLAVASHYGHVSDGKDKFRTFLPVRVLIICTPRRQPLFSKVGWLREFDDQQYSSEFGDHLNNRCGAMHAQELCTSALTTAIDTFRLIEQMS